MASVQKGAAPSGSGGPARALTDEQAMMFISEVLALMDADEVDRSCALFAYDGFNARTFKILLAKKIFAVCNGNRDAARKMLQEIISIIIERGSKIKKRGDLKMTEAAASRFSQLVRDLTISNFSQGEGGTQGARVVTLARVAVVLVYEIGMVLAALPHKAKVTVAGLPSCLSMPGAGALLPANVNEDHPLFAAMFEWNMAFAKLVGQPDSNETRANVVKFLNIAKAGNLYTQEERLRCLKTLRAAQPGFARWDELLGEYIVTEMAML